MPILLNECIYLDLYHGEVSHCEEEGHQHLDSDALAALRLLTQKVDEPVSGQELLRVMTLEPNAEAHLLPHRIELLRQLLHDPEGRILQEPQTGYYQLCADLREVEAEEPPTGFLPFSALMMLISLLIGVALVVYKVFL